MEPWLAFVPTPPQDSCRFVCTLSVRVKYIGAEASFKNSIDFTVVQEML